MTAEVFREIFIPFVGTTLGAACVFFMRDHLIIRLQKMFTGFAAGVMIAAAVFSLLIPSLESAAEMGRLAFVPAIVGFWLGVLLLFALDRIIPHLHINNEKAEGPVSKLKKTTMMILAVVLHNIPEGMAVGVVYAGAMMEETHVTFASALVLSIGIAIQNFPEGAIISIPLKAEGMSSKKAFSHGMLSGIVEPLAALVTIWAAQYVIPILPYLLGLAAGAMVYVVVEELIPEMAEGEHSHIGTIFFMIGFSAMIILEVVLG